MSWYLDPNLLNNTGLATPTRNDSLTTMHGIFFSIPGDAVINSWDLLRNEEPIFQGRHGCDRKLA